MKNTLVQGNLHCSKYFVPKKKLHYCKFYTVQNYTVRGIAVFRNKKMFINATSNLIKTLNYLHMCI